MTATSSGRAGDDLTQHATQLPVGPTDQLYTQRFDCDGTNQRTHACLRARQRAVIARWSLASGPGRVKVARVWGS
jgi:hypothetical protein